MTNKQTDEQDYDSNSVRLKRIAIMTFVASPRLRHKHDAWQRSLLIGGKMEPSADKLPGVREAATMYLGEKQIPQLFQV